MSESTVLKGAVDERSESFWNLREKGKEMAETGGNIKNNTKKGEKDNVETFRSSLAVFKFLKSEGYRISKNRVYHAVRSGLLSQHPTRDEVIEFAAAAELRARAAGEDARALRELTEKKIKQQIRNIRLKNKADALALKIRRGEYVPRESVEQDQALLALALDAGLRRMIHERIPEWIRAGGGDPDKVPEAVTTADRDLDNLMREFADASDFEVLIGDGDESA